MSMSTPSQKVDNGSLVKSFEKNVITKGWAERPNLVARPQTKSPAGDKAVCKISFNIHRQRSTSKLEIDLRKLKVKKDTIEYECGAENRNHGVPPEEREQIRRSLLLNADVICGTLSSIGSQALLEVFGNNGRKENFKPHFKCIIIDEATQACELDCLIPLQYGISKLVLVGDPEQLPPTVLSKKAAARNFGQSLFDRYYLFFKQQEKTPVIMLNTQYRMDEEICTFPSRYIYNSKLLTDRSVSSKSKSFPLYPYIVFDIEEGEEKSSQAGSICNLMEAEFTVQLCEFIVQTSKLVPEKIGIIAPYQKQKSILLGYLKDKHLSGIEVGTVDGFQGREKHVIVLSCVRAKSASGTIGLYAGKYSR
ncbi:hypothetical protein ScPMuIL_009958 [Solemya velum]